MYIEKLTDFKLIDRMIRYVTGLTKVNYGEEVAYKNEHSLIRSQMYYVEMEVPTFVSVHLTRHEKTGQFWYVSSNRADLGGNEEADRFTPVRMVAILNAKHIIDIFRYRHCTKASRETMDVMDVLLEQLYTLEPTLAVHCVPNCWYRGGLCPETPSCGMNKKIPKWYVDLYR